MQPHNHAALTDQQQLFFGAHHAQAHQRIAITAELDATQAQASAALQTELINGNPLAQATGGGHQNPRSITAGRLLSLAIAGLTSGRDAIGQLSGEHIHAHQAVAIAQRHGSHTASRAAQGSQILIVDAEMDRHAVDRADQHAVASTGQTNPTQGISFLEVDGNQAVGADVGEGR